MIVLYILLLAAILCLQYVIAGKFEKIAFAKGYDGSIHSFAMCFWLGLIGYLYVIALPTINKKEDSKNAASINESIETKATPSVTERYECSSFEMTAEEYHGYCVMCRKQEKSLRVCRIRNRMGLREIAICDDCIHLFSENCMR